MKKILSALIICAMMLALSSCGTTDSDVKGELNTGAVDTTAETTAAETEDSYEINLAKENTYENKYFGFGVKLSDEWTFSTEEEILQMNQLTADMLDDEMKKQLENANLLYEMQALKDSGIENMGINIENLGPMALLYSEEEYIKNQEAELKKALEQIGYTNVTITVKEIEFVGEKHFAAEITGIYQDDISFSEELITVKHGTRFANISIFTFNDNLDQIISYFYAV